MGRFIPNEETWVGFAATLVGTVDAPTVADVDGAVDLTHFITSLNAMAQGQEVPTPAFDTLFETSIPGTAKGSFTADFYRDDSADTAWTTLPRATEGFFIIARFGGKPDSVADKCEVWPVRVLSRAMGNMTNNAVVSFTVTASVPDVPGEDAVVAA